jgi:hypothetical protein
VLALRYLETLQELGKGSNKVFVPYEASAALGSVGMLKELFAKEGDPAPASRPGTSAAALSAQAMARTVGPPQSQTVPVRRNPPPFPQQDE